MKKQNRIINRAFTLIELLVVIAIIALLVSILLPSLNRAKALAKRAVCASNLRSINLVEQMYLSENDGWFPFWTSLSEDPTAPDHFADMANPVLSAPFYPIHKYLIGQADLLHCPSGEAPEMKCENGDPNDVDGGGESSLRNSYKWWRYSVLNDWGTTPANIANVKDTASQFLLYDMSWRTGPNTPADDLISVNHNSSGGMGSDGANVTYADGHTEWVPKSTDWIFIYGTFSGWLVPPDSPSW